MQEMGHEGPSQPPPKAACHLSVALAHLFRSLRQPSQLALCLSNGCPQCLCLIQQLLFPLSSLDDEVSLQGFPKSSMIVASAGEQTQIQHVCLLQ